MKITVIKQNVKGDETWQYEARVLLKKSNLVLLAALFNRDDTMLGEIVIRRNDRFLEYFFSDRWYNIFEIRDQKDDTLKGWYCDICEPALISENLISYRDLSLDLWVNPDGKMVVFDEDEFNQMVLNDNLRQKALESLLNLKENFFEIVNELPKVPK